MNFGMSLQSRISACTGAEVHLLPDGTFSVRLVQLSLQNKLIHIEEKKEQVSGLNELKLADIKGPLAITLTGRGVLIKKTSRLENVTEQSLRHLFPGFKPDEFYLQHFRSGAHSFVAFVRKEIADPVLLAFRKQGARVLLFGLGPFVADQVLPQLNSYEGNLVFDGHQVIFNPQKEWLDYQYKSGMVSEFDLKIDIERIPEQFLLAYATAFQLILNDRLELIEVEAEEIKQELVEFSAKLKFQKNGSIVLVSFFVLLLLNFLIFSWYQSKNQELAGRAGQRSDLYAGRQKLESEVKEKEMQVRRLGWNHGQNYAYLCDQIGQTVPSTILLHEVSINALKGNNMVSSEKNELETGSLKITGQSSSVYVINDWLYALKHKPWVKAVQLQKYATDDQKGIQVFTLLLNY